MSRTAEITFKVHCVAEIGDKSVEEEIDDLKEFIADDLHAAGYLNVYKEDVEILECIVDIKGLEKLTGEQHKHMYNVHKAHVACNGSERQKRMGIIEAWIDESHVVCVRLANGEWYHYYPDGSWG